MTETNLPQITRDAAGAPIPDFDGVQLPDNLHVEVLEAGDGAPVVEGQSITVHYSGWLPNGSTFDSSWGRGEPISFVIARGSLIDGWVDGIVGQPVGSKLLLSVPPEKGYGARAVGPIPPNSTLVFAVDVLDAR
ncbi:FKBP-type peptidyl-prolyl cis-trans isomerase [Demequina sp.]|uniref:FKBP-type peptidyl-prolyl cis-trans isomerase n=1 Tax=Demequina sp. TaxID=2050685 RepID=UPI003D12DF3A